MANTKIKKISDNFLIYKIDFKIKSRVNLRSLNFKCLSDKYLYFICLSSNFFNVYPK